MAQIILFGGGDGGGIIIGPNGVRPIPPFDPSMRSQLRGLSALLNGVTRVPGEPLREMGGLVNKLSNLVVEQVEAIVGPLEGEHSLIYQDDDGGFTCGSTGQPPIPIPWPPLRYPSFSELMTNGVLERELLDFLDESTNKGFKITEILEEPTAVADKLGRELSERTICDLEQLAPSQLEKISDPVDREVVQFFHQVADDGRFMATWATRPAEVAEQLATKLSDRAFDRILAGGSSTIFNSGNAQISPVVVGIVVVVIMLVPTIAGKIDLSIKDLSGQKKF